jgi:hypothetical protein
MFVFSPQLWLLILCRSKDHLLVCNNRLSEAPRCSILSRLQGCRKKPKTNILYEGRREKDEGRSSVRKKKKEEIGENRRGEEIRMRRKEECWSVQLVRF